MSQRTSLQASGASGQEADYRLGNQTDIRRRQTQAGTPEIYSNETPSPHFSIDHHEPCANSSRVGWLCANPATVIVDYAGLTRDAFVVPNLCPLKGYNLEELN